MSEPVQAIVAIVICIVLFAIITGCEKSHRKAPLLCVVGIIVDFWWLITILA